ncbi:MAG TPA: MFS transporter [Spirochaetota bacterium]
MKVPVRFRLSAMMFVQFCSVGAIVPLMSLYMKQFLGFSGTQIGTIFAVSSVSAFISPLIGSFVADRIISAKTLLSLCQLGIAMTLCALYFQRSFLSVFPLYVFYSLLVGPTFSLTNAITFHNSTDSKRSFGTIRLWGTVGWVFVGWALSLIWMIRGGDQSRHLPDALLISAASSFVLFIYALTLPSPKIIRDQPEGFFPTESIRVFRKRTVFLLVVLNFMIVFIERFHFFGASPFLRQSGVSEQIILPAMSTGQLVEIVMIAFTGSLLTRFGFRKTILLGLTFETLRFLLYFLATPAPLMYIALACHGFTYAFISMAAQIYIDSQCSLKSRTGVQLIVTMLTGGLAGITGNLVCGEVMDAATSRGIVDYRLFWMIPLLLSGMITVASALLIHEKWKTRMQVLITRFREVW